MTHWRLRWCQSSVHPWHPLQISEKPMRSFTSVQMIHTHIESSCLELKHLAVPHSSHLAHLAINHVVKPLPALEGSAGGDSG